MCCVGLGMVSTGREEDGGEGTLKPGFDHVEGMDGKRGSCASCKAGNGLDQRGGEARMVVVHEGGIGFIIL